MFLNGDVPKKTILYAAWNPEGRKEDDNSGLTAIEISKQKLKEGHKEIEEENFDVIDFLVSGSRDKTIRLWSC